MRPALPEGVAFVYRPRRATETPLYKLLESLYERVKGCYSPRNQEFLEHAERLVQKSIQIP